MARKNSEYLRILREAAHRSARAREYLASRESDKIMSDKPTKIIKCVQCGTETEIVYKSRRKLCSVCREICVKEKKQRARKKYYESVIKRKREKQRIIDTANKLTHLTEEYIGGK